MDIYEGQRDSVERLMTSKDACIQTYTLHIFQQWQVKTLAQTLYCIW